MRAEKMTKETFARYILSKNRRNGTLVPSRVCVRCGEQKPTEGHHFDYDKPEEVIWLCRACHMIEDGRMVRIHTKKKQPPKQCKICKLLKKPLRHGRCHSCNEYLRRHGVERPYIVDGRSEKAKDMSSESCNRCGRPATVAGKPIRGYCASCYTYLWRRNSFKQTKKVLPVNA
jgi:hypothetical protein